MSESDEILKEFLVESYENLELLDRELLTLEEDPNDSDCLASIFRTIHTIKGTCGFLALPVLEQVTHVGENLLVPIRDGEITLTQSITDSLLSLVDAVRDILKNLEATGDEGDDNYSDLVAQIQDLCKSTDSNTETDTESSEKTSEHSALSSTEQFEKQTDDAATDASIDAGLLDAPAPVAEQMVRIDVRVLDQLMNQVGELVLVRNQILELSSQCGVEVHSAAQRLNLITSELQAGVLKTRMRPIKNLWNSLPRLVRDLANSCDKKVHVQFEGEGTELDKTVLEAIKDPVTHIVRNSIDHGIEPSNTRLANGKPEFGTLTLRAYHEGGMVNVEISDDGNGIDLERVREKAISSGVVLADQAQKLRDDELVNLILSPGFSTAATVTNISGRGVGMDVVNTKIESLGGTLEIHSSEGIGTSICFKIPLTLAIVPALIVASDQDRYAIPQVNLLELVRIERQSIEFMHESPVYRLRGRLLPLLSLRQELGERRNEDSQEVMNVVVLQADDFPFGLIVDRICDSQEIVVKPLGRHLQNMPLYAGATIMGDGQIALILDSAGLARHGNISGKQLTQNASTDEDHSSIFAESSSWLVIEQPDGIRIATKLSSVARLEEFSAEDVENTGVGLAIQYRAGVMPLVDLSEDESTLRAFVGRNERFKVLVYESEVGNVGVAIHGTVDIVEHPSVGDGDDVDIVNGHVSRIINLPEFIAAKLSSQPNQLARESTAP